MDTPRTFAVNSSHSISGRVTRCLVILYPVGKNRLPAIALVAKSPDACKAITIAEILKRRIGEQGERWFQYTKLEGVMVNAKSPQKPNKKGGKPKNKNQGSDGEGDDDEGEGGEDSRGGSGGGGGEEGGKKEEVDDEEDPFQVLEEKVPVKKERVPVLTIYISRSPLPELASLYGFDHPASKQHWPGILTWEYLRNSERSGSPVEGAER